MRRGSSTSRTTSEQTFTVQRSQSEKRHRKTKNFPKQGKETDIQVQEAHEFQKTPGGACHGTEGENLKLHT